MIRFTLMLIGLKNASGMFQRAMDVLLTKIKWQFALAYLDVIVILMQIPGEHIEHVRQDLTLLNDACVRIYLKKFEFFPNCMDDQCSVRTRESNNLDKTPIIPCVVKRLLKNCSKFRLQGRPIEYEGTERLIAGL